MVFNDFKPTTQLLGRWQPWHKGHTELFKRALAETGQVIIMVRTVPQKEDASGGRTMVQDDNPFKASDRITVEQAITHQCPCLLTLSHRSIDRSIG